MKQEYDLQNDILSTSGDSLGSFIISHLQFKNTDSYLGDVFTIDEFIGLKQTDEETFDQMLSQIASKSPHFAAYLQGIVQERVDQSSGIKVDSYYDTLIQMVHDLNSEHLNVKAIHNAISNNLLTENETVEDWLNDPNNADHPYKKNMKQE